MALPYDPKLGRPLTLAEAQQRQSNPPMTQQQAHADAERKARAAEQAMAQGQSRPARQPAGRGGKKSRRSTKKSRKTRKTKSRRH